ncbi:LCP family protein [Caryophanon tenue]|uniref:Transcriptional regulator n=1 Tax=Caryophanon tenue TaxID=33978 RepID=A0A1C0YJT7_9BACL|nr:LCP family protein [Caryophanon tenue]OCS87413.1 transcriptional regulator [Caryophanon tenue]
MSKNTKKNSTVGLLLKVCALLVASLLLSATAYGVYLSKQAETAADVAFEALDEREVSGLREEKVEPLTDNISILFIGVDDSLQRSQGDGNSRSDALILATLNNKDKSIKLLSIPRDSYVYIPYVEYRDKITHAHAYGNTIATVETVENLFEIPVDYYVKMNFNAFIDVVNALGGIVADVPYDILEKDEFDNNAIQLTEGRHLLTGEEALALVRTRKVDSDIERGKRQQEVLKAIIQKGTSVTSITKYTDVIEALGDNMRTNMTFEEMKSLFSYLSDGSPNIENINLVGYDDMSTGVYYYKLDDASVEETKALLQEQLDITPLTDELLENHDFSTSDEDIQNGSFSEQFQNFNE